MNKKADGQKDLLEIITYFIIMIIFLLVLLGAIVIKSNNAGYYQQAYSKMIAMTIDKAKPGTKISMDLSELYDVARKSSYYNNLLTLSKKNNANPNIVRIDNSNHKVYVSLYPNTGYSFEYFSDVSVVWELKKEEKKLEMEII